MSASRCCPRCSGPVDPARAPVARVRAGRVLAYCSAACADRHGSEADVQGGEPAGPAAQDTKVPRRAIAGLGIALCAIGLTLAAAGISSGRSAGEPIADREAAAPAEVAPPDADESARAEAIRERVIEFLRDELEGGSTVLARRAAAALSRTGHGEAMSLLREELEREGEELERIAIAAALARAGDGDGLSALSDAAEAEDPDVASAAASALAELEQLRAESEAAGGTEAWASLGDADEIEALKAELLSPKRRIAAAEALRRSGGDVDLEPLAAAMFSERGAPRIAAAEALLILLLETPD